MNQSRSSNLVLLNWSAYFTGFSFFLLDIIISMIGIAIKASPVEIGLYFSSLMAAQIFSTPAAGLLVDRFGRKQTFVAGAFTRIASFAAIGFGFIFASSPLIILGRVFQGIAAGLFWTSLNALVSDETTEKGRGKEMGVVNQRVYAGMLTGALLGLLVLQLRLDLPLYLFAAASVVSGIFAMKISPATPLHRDVARSNSQNYASPARIYVALCLLTASYSFGYSIVGPFLTYFALKDLSSDYSLVALAYMPQGIVNSLLSARLGGLADKHGRMRPLMVGALGLIPVTFGYAFIGSLWQLTVTTTLVGVFSSAYSYAQNSLVGDITSKRRGSAYGFISMLGAGAAAVGAFVGGLLWSQGWWSLVIASVSVQLLAVPSVLLVASGMRNRKAFRIVAPPTRPLP